MITADTIPHEGGHALSDANDVRRWFGLGDPWLAVVLVLFTYLFLANSWVGDDTYITFRVGDNLIHGFGPRWNVDERVQAYTKPVVDVRHCRRRRVDRRVLLHQPGDLPSVRTRAAVAAAAPAPKRDGVRVSSRAGVLVEGVCRLHFVGARVSPTCCWRRSSRRSFRQTSRPARAPEPPRRADPWLASLAFVNRIDTVLLFAPALAYHLSLALRARRWTLLARACLAASPGLALGGVFRGVLRIPVSQHVLRQGGHRHARVDSRAAGTRIPGKQRVA